MKKSKVIFVDDDEDVLATFQQNFRKSFDVVVFNNPFSSLEYLSKTSDVAVILTDFRMPKMNGIEFLKQAQKVSPHSIRMILSGHADFSTVVDAINENNIFKFLLKPIAPEHLLSQLKEASQFYNLIEFEKIQLKINSLFTSTVSREYKNPLTAILTNTYLLENFWNNNSDKDFYQTIENIRKYVNSMSSELDKIILLSKMENEKFDLAEKIFLNSYLNETIEEYKLLFSKDIKLTSDLSDNIYLKSNSFLIGCLFRSLIENSLKFSISNEINVDISRKSNKVFVVMSNKTDLPDDYDINSLFIPFFTNHGDRMSGSGLGLTISTKSAELLSISFEISISSNIFKAEILLGEYYE